MSASIVRQSVCRILNGRTFGNVLRRHLSSVNSNIIKSEFPDVEIPNLTIPEYIFQTTAKYSNKIAFECCITGRRFTYNDVRTKSKNLNRALRKKLKLQKNQVVAILLPNVPEFSIAVLGCMLAGLRVTTLNPIYTADEISRQLLDSNASALITLSELFPVAKIALEKCQNTIPVLTINDQPSTTTPTGTINFKDFTDNELDFPEVELDDPNTVAFMPYSSGTTGLPKGVLLTHRNIISNLCQFQSPSFNSMITATDEFQDVFPAVLPMFHIYGFSSLCLGSMLSGAKILTIPKFAPDTYLQALVDHKPTILFVVPPIVIFLNSHAAVKKDYLQSVRVLMCGAAPLGALDEQKFREKIDKQVTVVQGYGLSETSPVVTLVPMTQGPRPGSVGCVVPNTSVKLVSIEDGTEVMGPNQKGELYVKGPQVMLGYHNRVEETNEALKDGWLRTGDLFYYDERGSFFVADRIKELIKVKGFQVPPAELEEIIRDYPDVADAAVIGIPHELHGEVPRAYVMAKPNKVIDTALLNEFVSEKVAEYKQLKGGIVVTKSIPKNASGKILRRKLKLLAAEEGKLIEIIQ